MIVLEVVAGVVGVFLLGRSGAVFVGSASRLALRLGVSSIVVGIVVIGFGTSAPELVVSAVAAFEGSADVGVGNVVGSNLSNLTLVLGIAAVAAPLRVSSSLLRREAPLMFASMVMFGIFVQRGLTRLEGLLLLGTLAALTLLLVRAARAARQPSSTVIGAGVVIMLASALSAAALMRRGFVLTRREGAMLIIAYVIAVTLLA